MKSQDDNKKIWEYLDGEANEQERTLVQQRLKDDAGFKKELQSRQQLNHTLKSMEPEQPSMRFVMDVMDSLPQLYKKAIEPLVSPKWVKAFMGGLVIFVVGLFGFAAATADSASLNNNIPGENLVNQLYNMPTSVFTSLAMASFSYLFLVILDRQLKKRFIKK